MNAAQGALYAANAEVARHESELRHAEETRQRLESQHTERRAQLGAWREQRSQLTLALHMWAARSVTAKDNVAAKQAARWKPRTTRLPQAEQAFRAAQEQAERGAQRRCCRRTAGCRSSRPTSRTWSAARRASSSGASAWAASCRRWCSPRRRR